MTDLVSARLTALWAPEKGLKGLLGTVDHKQLGIRYIWTAFAFMLIGGIEAAIMRLQLAAPGQSLVGPHAYDQLFTMHGVTMIFWYASPILSGFGNYLVPLMLGARDMAFPRLNAFSYWAFLLSGILLHVGLAIGQAPSAGWFAYAPMTEVRFSPGLGMDFYCAALVFLTFSTTAGAVNFIVTIFRHRAPGMTLGRMPLLMYSTLTTSLTVLFSLPALTACCAMLELQRRWGFHFFDLRRGGDPLLWQHLFWFFGHPWVYVVFLPATGMISMILPVHARRPIVGYGYVAVATMMTAIVGFGVWVHHMFAVGMSHLSMSFFSAASMTISVFTTIQVFAWVATLVRGRVVLTSPMLFCLGFIAALVMGGLSGVVTAIIPFDWQVHDTYFVVAHLHYVLIGANLLPALAALHHWYPKMFGRALDERLARWSFGTIFVGFNLAFFPMHASGLLGMARRVYTYPAGLGVGGLNLLSTVGAFMLGLGLFMVLVNCIRSRKHGRQVGKNPWHADTLEWSTESPPPVYGSVTIPTVRTRHPLWDHHDEEKDPLGDRMLDERRMTVSTSLREARPVALALMPKDSLAPLACGIILFVFFAAVVARSPGALALTAALGLAATAFWLWPRTPKAHEISVPLTEHKHPDLPWDQRRGAWGMLSFIGTEALLFVCLFFAYFYLAQGWSFSDEPAPKLHFALPMLGVLLLASTLLHVGGKLERQGRRGLMRVVVSAALVLGVVFLVLQASEYREMLEHLRPQDRAYGSIFYLITGLHGLHVLFGVACLVYILVLPPRGEDRPPHRPLHSVALYWHFVDVVWVFIILILYLLPRWAS